MKISTGGFILACASISFVFLLFYYARALLRWFTGGVGVQSVFPSVFGARGLDVGCNMWNYLGFGRTREWRCVNIVIITN
jgi:hypothetical protein